MKLIQRAETFGQHIALKDQQGEYTYQELCKASAGVAAALLERRKDLKGIAIPFMAAPGLSYVAAQWGIWRAGGIAVPLCLTHPVPELSYVLQDIHATMIVADPAFRETIARTHHSIPDGIVETHTSMNRPEAPMPAIKPDDKAMILYTSGTTSKPKGVVLTHANVESQITCLIEAWQWSPEDRILHFLPLHHTHGIINVLCCALWAGAFCECLPKFDAETVWEKIQSDHFTLLMAVPTIYHRLIRHWEAADAGEKDRMTQSCHQFRVMISGSAALPVPTLQQWEKISGHTLLERYGMTEIGMALSNPLDGERKAGYVGQPLPGVEVKLVDEQGAVIEGPGEKGEIWVKGANVFREYWKKPEATASAFRDGWFRTGDIASLEGGYYKIHGRNSVDIIKSGGYKISALEIETVLLMHPAINEVAVIGIAHEDWGEQVAAYVVMSQGDELSLKDLRMWAKEKLAVYKLPGKLVILDALPRNALGKVMKNRLAALRTAV